MRLLMLASSVALIFAVGEGYAKDGPIDPTGTCSATTANTHGVRTRVNVNSGSHSASFPPYEAGKKEYVIQGPITCARIHVLSIPDGYTIRVAPGVKNVNWIVDILQIGADATIDLSAPQSKLPKLGQRPPEPQAGYCDTGHSGAWGRFGQPGTDAANLDIGGLQTFSSGQGSLWIKTDGGPGQDGQDGQGGSKGGGRQGGFGCGARPGGDAGYGGAGGVGGHASTVRMTTSNGSDALTSNGLNAVCGPSSRPTEVSGPTGVIIAWGARGCNGELGHVGSPNPGPRG